jgi:tripartite-type tricarboxylate transporter receptor subunit TctC
MRMFSSKKLLVPAVAAALAVGSGAALAQAGNYPDKPVKIVVGFTAGGTTDIISRAVANELMQIIPGSNFVIENKPGAGGDIGAAEVIRSAPDGYTLLMASVGPMAINPTLKKLKHDPLKDLAPIILVADVPNVLVVSPEKNIKNWKEFAAFAKANDGKLNYPSTGTGTSAHLSGFMLMDRMGLKATHVPYKGAEALNDLLAGRTDFMFATIPSVIGQIKAGKLVAIAVTSNNRSRSLPDVPTVQEVGFPGYQAGSWFGLLAPTGTPQAIIDKINKDVNTIMPKLEDRFIQAGADPVGGPPKLFQDFIMSEYTKWRKVIQDSGAAAQ